MSAYRDALADLLEWAAWHCGHPGPAAVSRARALLAEAQPQPVAVPTQQELEDLADTFGREYDEWRLLNELDAAAFARAVLARWGRPAPEPVSVAERLPTAADCDAHGRCWWLRQAANPEHDLLTPTYLLQCHGSAGTKFFKLTHWLPHWALPVPQEHTP
jgi:hypothetical protein